FSAPLFIRIYKVFISRVCIMVPVLMPVYSFIGHHKVKCQLRIVILPAAAINSFLWLTTPGCFENVLFFRDSHNRKIFCKKKEAGKKQSEGHDVNTDIHPCRAEHGP